MNIDELKEKYDIQKVRALEDAIFMKLNDISSTEKAIYEQLFYLEATKRFRENPIFKKAPFSVYVETLFGINHSSYMKKRKAYINFEAEVKQHGIGFVTKVIGQCEAKDVKRVFKKISEASGKAKKPLNIEQKFKIVSDFIAPSKKSRNSGMAKPELYDIIAEKDREIAALTAEIKEKDAQILRLKRSLSKLQEIQAFVDRYMESVDNQNELSLQ